MTKGEIAQLYSIIMLSFIERFYIFADMLSNTSAKDLFYVEKGLMYFNVNSKGLILQYNNIYTKTHLKQLLSGHQFQQSPGPVM